MEKLYNVIKDVPNMNSIFLSVFLWLIYVVIINVLIRRINKNDDFDLSEKILTIKKIKDYGKLILIMCVFFLWFTKLQTVFISLLAVAAAIVIALKEIIMCLTGGSLIRANNYFKLGDRIEIDGIRGFVIDKSLTATKVLEIGPEKNSQQTTGNIVSFPNSIVLSKSLTNESYFQDFSIKSFIFNLHDKEKIDELEIFLLEIGREVCSQYLDNARQSISNYCSKEGFAIPSVDPRVKLIMTETGEIKLLLKIPVNNKEIADIEQKLIKKYLNYTKINNKGLNNE